MPAAGAADESLVTFHRIPRSPRARGRALTLVLGAVVAALLLAPGLANALVINVQTGATTTTVGVQPTSEAKPLDGNGKGGGGAPDAGKFNNLEGKPVVEGEPTTKGNPTTNSVDTYLIYWENPLDPQDPQDLRLYPGEWQALIDGFMSNLSGASETGGNDVFTVDAQYTGLTATGQTGHATGQTRFLGAYTDTNPYPVAAGCTDEYLKSPPEAACINDAQIREQLHTFIGQHGLKAGMNTIFYVLTPPGVGVCVGEGGAGGHCSQDNGQVTADGFCSYHSYYPDPQYGTVLYATIPWTFGDTGGIFGEAANTGSECQDGGWNVNAEKGGPLEQQKSPPQVPQEPNQLPALGADGTWDEGVADLTVGQIASEQQNTITDPLLNAWQDKEKVGGEEVGYENTDECRNFFLAIAGGSAAKKEHTEAGNLSNQTIFGGFYYANDAFNLAAQKLSYPGVPCLPGIRLIPGFTEPPTVNSGEVVGFNGMESDISLNVGETFTPSGEEKLTYPTYTWNFGDNSPEVTGYAPGGPAGNPPSQLCEAPWLSPCAASTFHSYTYGGTYKVVLTVKDVAGNTATVEHTITVVGPPAPTPPGPPPPVPSTGTGSGSGSGSGSGGSGPGGSGSVSSIPPPVATAATVSSSIKQVARSGLVVRYTVNEQVTGRFEVLLSAAIAHRLGLSGPAATGLPPGFAKSVVIGHALLVTLKGGHSSVRIKLSKRNAKHLRRAHNVTLTLRMTVRNASSQSPLFTTVMSSSVLH
jgi:hypothetical protein